MTTLTRPLTTIGTAGLKDRGTDPNRFGPTGRQCLSGSTPRDVDLAEPYLGVPPRTTITITQQSP